MIKPGSQGTAESGKEKPSSKKDIANQGNLMFDTSMEEAMILDTFEKESNSRFSQKHRDQRIYRVIQHVFDQQMFMYQNKVDKCNDGIENIHQPHVRMIVRG